MGKRKNPASWPSFIIPYPLCFILYPRMSRVGQRSAVTLRRRDEPYGIMRNAVYVFFGSFFFYFLFFMFFFVNWFSRECVSFFPTEDRVCPSPRSFRRPSRVRLGSYCASEIQAPKRTRRKIIIIISERKDQQSLD